MALQFEIVTPEKTVLSTTVEAVYFPGLMGETGILSAHTAMVGAIEPGVLKYVIAGKEEKLAVGAGFAEIKDDKLIVITDLVASADEVDSSKLSDSLAKLQASLEGLNLNDHEDQIKMIEGDIARVNAQLAL